jgi:hypothetical protein
LAADDRAPAMGGPPVTSASRRPALTPAYHIRATGSPPTAGVATLAGPRRSLLFAADRDAAAERAAGGLGEFGEAGSDSDDGALLGWQRQAERPPGALTPLGSSNSGSSASDGSSKDPNKEWFARGPWYV